MMAVMRTSDRTIRELMKRKREEDWRSTRMIRITIVKDESFMREELSLILKRAGYEVCEVQTFQETYKEIIESNPDLVLLDINLPGQSGFEICKQLKEKELCPVMILTSRTQTEG